MDKALTPYVKGGGAKVYEEELKKMYGMEDGDAGVSTPSKSLLACSTSMTRSTLKGWAATKHPTPAAAGSVSRYRILTLTSRPPQKRCPRYCVHGAHAPSKQSGCSSAGC